ncbi:MAG: chorismate mutase [Verrucomicrobia bacterium]|nr:chorismate mutase [Verrucomicrobiota bacterium]
MNLDELRKIIDQLNTEIIELFSKRLSVTKEIAKVKKENQLPVHDPLREEKQLQMLREAAKKHGLSPAVIEEIFNLFVDYSKMNMKLEMGNEQKSRLPGN